MVRFPLIYVYIFRTLSVIGGKTWDAAKRTRFNIIYGINTSFCTRTKENPAGDDRVCRICTIYACINLYLINAIDHYNNNVCLIPSICTPYAIFVNNYAVCTIVVKVMFRRDLSSAPYIVTTPYTHHMCTLYISNWQIVYCEYIRYDNISYCENTSSLK
ncbi:hypothetical protein QTP88_017886 [Uroleucon formosanum]